MTKDEMLAIARDAVEPMLFVMRVDGVIKGTWPNWHDDATEILPANDPEIRLIDVARAKRAAIDAAYVTRVAAGVAFGGYTYQIDDVSLGRISSRATRAGLYLGGVAGVTWPAEGMPFRPKENVWLSLTAADFVALGQAADDTFTAIRVRYAELKTALADALADGETTPAQKLTALEAIDESASW